MTSTTTPMLGRARVYAILSVVLYGIQSVVLDVKLKSFTPGAVLLSLYVVMAPSALLLLAGMRLRGEAVVWPPFTLPMFGVFLLVGVAYFYADWAMVQAYHLGGNSVSVTSILLVVPLIAATGRFFLTGTLPTIKTIVGYLLIVTGLALV